MITLFSGTVTASGEGPVIDLGQAGMLAMAFYLNVTAVSGTSPTLDVKLQDSPDGTAFYDLASFAQKTAVGKEAIRVTQPFARRLKVVYTVGGTSPSFTFSVVGVPRYDA